MELVESVPWMGDLVVHRYRLANGLQALVLPDPSAPVFAFNAWFRVGSRHERPGRTGLAHLFEHLMFKGTETRPEGELDREMEARGASTNAGTYLDWTFYTESMKPEYLDFCLEAEADRMQNLTLNAEQLETEREVVKNERLLRTENDPEGAMQEALYELAYTAHAYRWPVIGRKPDLDVIGLEDCRGFYRRFYSPGNCTLVLVGDLDPEDVAARVERHYGGIRAEAVPEVPAEPEPPQRCERRRDMEQPVSSDLVLVGYHVPRYTHEDLPALEVLSTILFDGASSRVERRLVGDLQLATAVRSYVANTFDAGLWEIQLTMRGGVPAWRGEVVLYEELDRVAREWVGEEELEKARSKLESSFLRSLRDSSDKAFQLGFHEMAAGDFRVLTGLLDRYRRVTREDVRAAAAAYLGRHNRTVVVARPTLIAAGPGAGGEPCREELSGGAQWMAVPSRDLPLATVRLVLRAGAAADPPGREGLTALTSAMLLRGTRRRLREAFEEAVDALGGRLGIHHGRLTTTLGGSVPARNLPAYLDLVFEALSEPAFPDPELEKQRLQTASELAEMRNDDASLLEYFFRRHLFPSSPFGRDARGSLPALAAITGDEVRAHGERLLGAANLVLGAAGEVEPAALRESLQGHLEALPGGERTPLPDAPAALARGRRLLLVDKPERSQVHYAVGHPGIPAGHADWIPLLIAETAFGGTFTSVLMHELREKRGWTYGVYSGNARARLPDVYEMVCYPGVAEAPECLRVNLELFEAYCRGELADEAVEAARAYLMNRFPFVRDTPAKRLDRMMELEFLELRPDFWETYLDDLCAVTPDQVRAAAARHRQAENLSIVMICTAAELEPRLREAGLAFDEVETVSFEEVAAG